MSWLFPGSHRHHGPGGLWFCGCTGLPIVDGGGGGGGAGGRVKAATPQRAPVVIGGRRVRTVDVHAHCYFQSAIDLMGAEAKAVLPPVKGVPEHFLQNTAERQLEKRFAAMDAMGIDLQVLSINPYWYRQDRDNAEAICRIHNQGLAELCAQHPGRLAAFASLAMQFPDLAVQQLEEAVKTYGLKGAAIGGSVAGADFCQPQFHPVLAKAQELGVTLFIHPQSTPELQARFKGNGWLSNVIGNPLDTTIALQKLIFEGVFDQYPQLKVLAAHGGGFLGSYAPRMDRSCFVSPQNCNAAIVLKKKPTEYIRQIYFDSLVFTAEALRHLAAEVGTGQIMVGTDHPIPWEDDPVGHVMGTPELSDEARIAILGGNAIRVLGLDLPDRVN
ncbi:MAG: amidohydrolase [Pseudomonadota bacterium]|nr:amidohydrolase [Pseudomonadota bacterium]